MSKTSLMHFSPKNHKLKVAVEGTTIPQVHNARFLGILGSTCVTCTRQGTKQQTFDKSF